jgi:hypothetical protein
MPVEIGEMDVSVEVDRQVRQAGAGAPGSPAPLSPQGLAALRDALRPVVQQIVQEELERVLREGR